jgi:hypothetical protein
MRHTLPVVLLLSTSCARFAASAAEANGRRRSVPIVYSSDLYHPHDDPDDHFDLATLFAISEFDIRGIIIDTGPGGAGRPGFVAVQQMMHITGRIVPYTAGLVANLRSQGDRAEHQPGAAQGGVNLILKTLRESQTPVTIFTTGSLRDVAAAYNREPGLFRKKTARLYINIGHAGGDLEWNVKLDPHAFVRILDSPLPVYWVPCFGPDGLESHWQFRQGDVLETAPLAVQNYIVYALTKASPNQRDPIKALTEPIPQPIRDKVWAENRSMWCTAAFLHAAGRENPTFTFTRVRVHLDNNGTTRITHGPDGLQTLTIRRGDPGLYAASMRETLRELCKRLEPVP